MRQSLVGHVAGKVVLHFRRIGTGIASAVTFLVQKIGHSLNSRFLIAGYELVNSNYCTARSVRNRDPQTRRGATLDPPSILIFTFFIALVLSSAPALALPQGSLPSEYQLKAAFLFNFAKFIEWPPSAFSSDTAPLTLCIAGVDPFGNTLDSLISGKQIDSRGIAARRTKNFEDVTDCHVVFVDRSEDRHLSEIVDDLKGGATLLVGESPNFAGRGGDIQFYMQDGKIRFAINVDAVQRSRLKVSAKLLALARIVHDAGHSTGGMR